jgi:hypothetical protein
MIILSWANSQLVYQSALAVPRTVWFPAIRVFSGASGRLAKEMRIILSVPVGLQEIFNIP